VFDDDRYWVVEVHYAKAGPDDLLMTVEVTNAGPEATTLHVLPTAWYRNTWSWEAGARRTPWRRPADGVGVPHPFLGELELVAGPGPDGTRPSCCSATTRPTRAALRPAGPALPQGRHQRPRRGGRADREPRPAGQQVRRLVPAAGRAGRHGRAAAAAAAAAGGAVDLGRTSTQVRARRRAEADEFYAELTPRRRPRTRRG
jgi:hypothetical protein